MSPAPDPRTRIVTAAARLLAEDGVAAVTTRSVALAAGVQAPAIYRLFGDKDGLLDAVAEHVLAEFVAAKTEHAAAEVGGGGDPVADLRDSWRVQVAFGLANPALFRLLYASDRDDDSPAVAAGLEVLRARVHRVAAAGRLRVPEEQAVAMIRAAGAGSMLTMLAGGHGGGHASGHGEDVGVGGDGAGPSLPELMLDTVLAAIVTDPPVWAGGDPDEGASMTLAALQAVRAAAPALPGLTDPERALLQEWLGRATTAS
ncbi:TetR/AcrR family transcriptional regulator [Curtobacterium sp. MCBD17_030]|uniref:TetR/AcrR family transcriptional regulator n=1 Tax=Curtobacterium sp. MCBD17_030 TaxID=2175649 RepID=UPI000D845579|nr:TetR/AcrR family transcriptional regulator [Curtobacterium sp. MCBD17_030]PYY36507.1 TetR family transcriptional regulator [Curtobacterium sp. MCBD17_030]